MHACVGWGMRGLGISQTEVLFCDHVIKKVKGILSARLYTVIHRPLLSCLILWFLIATVNSGAWGEFEAHRPYFTPKHCHLIKWDLGGEREKWCYMPQGWAKGSRRPVKKRESWCLLRLPKGNLRILIAQLISEDHEASKECSIRESGRVVVGNWLCPLIHMQKNENRGRKNKNISSFPYALKLV